MGKNGDFYHKLRKIWKEAFPFKTAKSADAEFQKFWKENKEDRNALENKFKELNLKKTSSSNVLLQSFAKQMKISTQKTDPEPPTIHIEPRMIPLPAAAVDLTDTCDSTNLICEKTKRSKPAQESAEIEIRKLSERIIALSSAKSAGLLSDEQLKELKDSRLLLSKKKSRLNRLQAGLRASKKYRKKLQQVLQRLKKDHPEILHDVKVHETPGRPPLDRQFPDLQDVIIDITTAFSGADARRRSEQLRCIRTLDDLLKELKDRGINISRSGLYLRLLPRDSSSREGKRHKTTVPVKLIRAQNDFRSAHEDSHFASATIKYLKDLASRFGGKSVFVLSQDDKARVPLGLPAANKQGPILMCMDYKVRLPDHDWMVASRHKLIPSVYAALNITDGRVTYSGPTYIAIRSGKHDSSTAYSHAIDIEKLCKSSNFASFTRNLEGRIKPIWIILVDGGPDENPRFPKTLNFAAQHFKNFDLDALFIATHAPHQSASNPVERRMAPLSRDLSGIILPHDTFGSHLDSNGKTIDVDLERKNFERAAQVLGEIWSERVIDGYKVEAEYVPPRDNLIRNRQPTYVLENELDFLTEDFKLKHVRQSQYLLQISKCTNQDCCKPKTNLKQFLKSSFIPPPVRFFETNDGLEVADPAMNVGSFLDLSTRICLNSIVPSTIHFDTFCPSLAGKISDRVCSSCNLYFVTKKTLQSHRRLHKEKADLLVNLNEVEESFECPNNESEDIHLITDMNAWLQGPFIEEQ